MFIVKIISLNDKDLALVISNPLLVSVIQVAQILDADALFVVTSTFLDLRD
jgi:hypothetical protein